MDLEEKVKAVADKYRLTYDQLMNAMPHLGWIVIHGLSDEKIVGLAELIAADLAERKGKAHES
jgi:hypothetical protein